MYNMPYGESGHPSGTSHHDKPPASFRDESPQTPAGVYAIGFSRRDNKLVQDLTALYTTSALYVGFVDQYIAVTIAEKAADAAIGWVAVAKKSKRLYDALEFVAQTNTYLLLASSHGAIAYAIAIRFNLLPKRLIGGFFTGTPQNQHPESAQVPSAVPANPQYAANAVEELARQMATGIPVGQSTSPTPENSPGVPGASTYELAPQALTASANGQRPSMDQVMRFIAEQTAKQRESSSVVNPPPAGYNPSATIPDIGQNPAVLNRIVPRRE